MKNWFLLSPSFEGLFSMSCSGLIRQSTNTRHLLTICTQKATRFDKGSCRSRCRGQAGNSLSCSALSRTSLLDSRAKHGNDRGEEKNTGMTGKNKSPGMTVLFFLLSSSNSSLSYSGLARISPSDSRVKPATACHVRP